MKQVYLAHPLSAKTPLGIIQNKEKAQLWLQWACDHYRPDYCFNMMWLLECQNVYSPGEEAGGRDAGMQRNFAHIRRCDELWLTGSRVSPGMGLEALFANRYKLPAYDLTTESLDPRTTPRFPPEDMILWKPGSLSEQISR